MRSITMSVVPIKVKVTPTSQDRPKFPDWQMLPMAEKKSPIDDMFFSWYFDRVGYRENVPHSPYGIQWAIRLVSKQFAKEAVKQFSDEVIILTEKDLEDFWDNYITAHLPDQLHDHEQLMALNARLQITKQMDLDDVEIRQRISKALDPDDPSAGVRWHPYKEWRRFKKENHIRIIKVKQLI